MLASRWATNLRTWMASDVVSWRFYAKELHLLDKHHSKGESVVSLRALAAMMTALEGQRFGLASRGRDRAGRNHHPRRARAAPPGLMLRFRCGKGCNTCATCRVDAADLNRSTTTDTAACRGPLPSCTCSANPRIPRRMSVCSPPEAAPVGPEGHDHRHPSGQLHSVAQHADTAAE